MQTFPHIPYKLNSCPNVADFKMINSYIIVIIITLTAIIPGVKDRYRLTLLEFFICSLLLVAPWSLMRDVPEYQNIFEDLLGVPGFSEVYVRIMLAACFISILEVMARCGFSMGSIIAFIFLTIPTVAANQLRLSFSILIMLYLSNRLSGISSIVAGSIVHQSLVLNLFLRQMNESHRIYRTRVLILVILSLVAIINLQDIIEILLPYLGNVGVYFRAKEISDMYDHANYLSGIEFVLFFLFVSIQARSVWPAFLVSAAFMIAKSLTDIPSVISMRFFELFCLLIILTNFRSLRMSRITILFYGLILLSRFYLHYSEMPT